MPAPRNPQELNAQVEHVRTAVREVAGDELAVQTALLIGSTIKSCLDGPGCHICRLEAAIDALTMARDKSIATAAKTHAKRACA